VAWSEYNDRSLADQARIASALVRDTEWSVETAALPIGFQDGEDQAACGWKMRIPGT
jgi:hypothetical protein